MRWFNIFTLLVAGIISVSAAYYSIVGLTAIFSAAFWSIVIMGSALELAKLTSAVWLHLNWYKAKWWIKCYMTPAVVVLMLITSMGIFGFLSKAHIEQAATTQEASAQIDRLDDEMARLELSRTRAVEKIAKLESGNTGADAALQSQIDREQQRVDNAYLRVQSVIDEQNQLIDNVTNSISDSVKPQRIELEKLQNQIREFDEIMSSGNVKQAQLLLIQTGHLLGNADGKLGQNTSAAIQSFRESVDAKKAKITAEIKAATNVQEEKITAARAEIARLRSTVEQQLGQSRTLIAELSSQLGQQNGTELKELIDSQNRIIIDTNTKTEELLDSKFELEREVRKLEAEVGPIKYVAEMIFGEADKTLLERAVQWMILLLVTVFDPLAVVMILAATGGIVTAVQKKK